MPRDVSCGQCAQDDYSGGMINNTGTQALARHVHARATGTETGSGNVQRTSTSRVKAYPITR